MDCRPFSRNGTIVALGDYVGRGPDSAGSSFERFMGWRSQSLAHDDRRFLWDKLSNLSAEDRCPRLINCYYIIG
jgi:hypothetical protein